MGHAIQLQVCNLPISPQGENEMMKEQQLVEIGKYMSSKRGYLWSVSPATKPASVTVCVSWPHFTLIATVGNLVKPHVFPIATHSAGSRFDLSFSEALLHCSFHQSCSTIVFYMICPLPFKQQIKGGGKKMTKVMLFSKEEVGGKTY